MKATDPRTFRALWPEFAEPSWRGWNAIENAAFALPLDPEDRALVANVTGGRALPSDPVKEVWAAVGRGGGKSRWTARLGVYFALGRSYRRAPGERIYAGIFAPDRKQAAITFSYVMGLLRSVPALEREIERELSESVHLRGGTAVEVITSGKAAPRGRSYCAAVVEEAAFLPSDESVNPDTELLRAVRPGLGRVPGSLLVVVSSPYSRRGELWNAYRKHYGKDSPHHLVIQAPTAVLNPAFDPAEIERAYEDDPESAKAEYGALFRSDLESFVATEVVEAATVPGRQELPPVHRPPVRYAAFTDPSGGSSDSFTLAIGHLEGDRVVVDLLRERKPPFSPAAVVEDYAADLRRYGVRTVQGDRYAGEWPREAFTKHGVTYEPAAKPKSDLYRDFLPLLNGGRVALLDLPKLSAQLVGLERRTARGGRDSIDHPPNAHDDLANVVAGLAVQLAVTSTGPTKSFGAWGREERKPLPPAAEEDRTRERWREGGTWNLTETGRVRYAHLVRDVPESELRPDEIMLLRRQLARRLEDQLRRR